MKKNYETPSLEVTKFFFEDTLADVLRPSQEQEETVPDAGDSSAIGDGDIDWEW